MKKPELTEDEKKQLNAMMHDAAALLATILPKDIGICLIMFEKGTTEALLACGSGTHEEMSAVLLDFIEKSKQLAPVEFHVSVAKPITESEKPPDKNQPMISPFYQQPPNL